MSLSSPVSCVSRSVCPRRRRCGEVASLLRFPRWYCRLRSCRRCVRVGCSVPRVLVLVFGGGALLPLWWWSFLCGDGVGGVRLWCLRLEGCRRVWCSTVMVFGGGATTGVTPRFS
ncbi:hypothetical protein QL285_097190 [Trifolium repens]|nr:hypothetical protein QL285_097190 [Trifolium repens]